MATNEELAAAIQAGDRDKLPELWEQVGPFISMKSGMMARTLDGFGGVTAEDLYQSGYLAMVAAVEAFDPDRGYKFLTYLSTCLKTAFAEAAGYRSKKRDWLDYAGGLNDPIPGTDDLTPADTVADARAAQDFEDAERRIWLSDLRRILDGAMEALPPLQRATVEAHHYQGKTLREIAEKNGVSIEAVRQRERKALCTLGRNKGVRELGQYLDLRTDFYRGGHDPVAANVLWRETLEERFVTRQPAEC